MKRNVGNADKKIRIAIGVIALLTGLLAPISAGVRIAVFVVSALAFGTAFSGL